MTLLNVLLILGLALDVIGAVVIAILLLAVIVGGSYDLFMLGVEHIHQRRSSRGLCAQCGYDLRCSRDRCPECGRFIRTFPHPGFLRT
jgi:hypothetical protein